MSLETDLEAAFRKASEALDEAWSLSREIRRMKEPSRLPVLATTYSSLADSFGDPIENMLRKASALVDTMDDAAALSALAGAAHAQGLVSDAALERFSKRLKL